MMNVDKVRIDSVEEANSGFDGTDILLHSLRELNTTLDMERSFKLRHGSISADRVLVGVDCVDIDWTRLNSVLESIGMPENLVSLFRDRFPGANKVFFGFDGGSQRIYKVYLEFWEQLIKDLRTSSDKYSPRLLFLGFKWNNSDKSSQAVDCYDCYPMLPVPAIITRIDDICVRNSGSSPRDIVRRLINQAARPLIGDSFVYTEVSDDMGQRRSFDLNLYKSGLLLGQVEPFLTQMRDYYSIDSHVFMAATEPNLSCHLGHLSGGWDRLPGSFLTVYYETEELPCMWE